MLHYINKYRIFGLPAEGGEDNWYKIITGTAVLVGIYTTVKK